MSPIKDFFLLILSLFLLFACNQKTEKKEEPAAQSPTPAPANNFLSDYAAFVKGLDTTDVTSISAAAKEYDQLFAETDSVQADSGFIRFNMLYDKMEDYLNERHIKDSTNYTAYVEGTASGNATKSPVADAYVEKLKENGFDFAVGEGSTFIRQDRAFLSKYFYPHISSVMKDYLERVNKENEEGLLNDAGLAITPVQLSNRVLWWENFLKTYPSFVFGSEIKEKQKGNLTFLLEGIDNTPLLNPGSNTLNGEYKKAFQNVLTSQPSSETAGLIRPYFAALKQRDIKTARKFLLQYKKQGLIYDYSA